MIVVFDTNVVTSAIFWPASNARRCLAGVARDQFCMAVTEDILEEYGATCLKLHQARRLQSPWGQLDWIRRAAVVVLPSPLGKRRSRDQDDDKFLACALSVKAEYIITYDRDLLALGKPFGIRILTPSEFLRLMEEQPSS